MNLMILFKKGEVKCHKTFRVFGKVFLLNSCFYMVLSGSIIAVPIDEPAKSPAIIPVQHNVEKIGPAKFWLLAQFCVFPQH